MTRIGDKPPVRCFYCEEPIFKRTDTKDHIIPKMLGGTNHETNKVKCCLYCNRLKANYLPRHFMDIIEMFLIPKEEIPELKTRLRKIYLKCLDLEINHIPKHKELMIKKPFDYDTINVS
jgi:5-methylcytosine-specific restriction endonuclease McrA